MHGSSRVMDEVQDALYHIRSLQDFRYIDPVTHKDEGANVRIKAKQVIDLVSDERVLQEERQKSKELYLKVANSGGASRFGGISSNDLYTGYNRDYVAGSEVAAGGRYNNTYEYFEAAKEPVAARSEYEWRASVSEEEGTGREPFTYELSNAEHVHSRSSTLPGAVRLGPGSNTSSETQSRAANVVSPARKTKEPQSDVSDLISWDENEPVSKTSKERAVDSDEMINWDSEFNPRLHETHSSSTDKKKSPMDWLLESASGSPTTGRSNTSSFASSQGRVSGFAKVDESKSRTGLTGFETLPSTLQNENTRIDTNERLVSAESWEQGFSTMKGLSNKKPMYGSENLTSSRTNNINSDSKTTVTAASASLDPFGSLVNDFMSTKLGQANHMKDSAKAPNQSNAE
ncbi:Epsin-2 [Galdieria sulphuraria]|nr:Epsin-2 [Galdieria sulphuraria]